MNGSKTHRACPNCNVYSPLHAKWCQGCGAPFASTAKQSRPTGATPYVAHIPVARALPSDLKRGRLNAIIAVVCIFLAMGALAILPPILNRNSSPRTRANHVKLVWIDNTYARLTNIGTLPIKSPKAVFRYIGPARDPNSGMVSRSELVKEGLIMDHDPANKLIALRHFGDLEPGYEYSLWFANGIYDEWPPRIEMTDANGDEIELEQSKQTYR